MSHKHHPPRWWRDYQSECAESNCVIMRATCDSVWRDGPYEVSAGDIITEAGVRYRVHGVSGFGHELLVRPLPAWRQPMWWRGVRKGMGHPVCLVGTALVLLWLVLRSVL